MQPMLNIAVRAARRAGDFIIRKMNRLADLKVEIKSPNDFASEVDYQAEERIIDTLLKAYPDHSILAEECGNIKGNDGYLWIIDPLDGTTNYLHGFPHFAVSIACQHNGRLQHGVIYDPLKQEIFAASRGDGATLNDRRIRVSHLKSTQRALLSNGFPFKHDYLHEFQVLFAEFFNTAGDIRRSGSTALDLAYVASARLDGYWGSGLQPWDIAAGALILREAGGLISDYQGDGHYLENGQIVAANPKVLADMLRIIQSAKR